MFVFDNENTKIEFDVNIGTLKLVEGQKINASSKVIEKLLNIANYLSKEKNRHAFIAFKKYGYIMELYEEIEEDPEPVELTKEENEILEMFEELELRDVVSMINILYDLDYNILYKFLLNLFDYIIKSMSADELVKYFESCRIDDDEEIPDYVI